MSEFKVLIIEDEPPAAKRLSKLLSDLEENIEIIDVIDSVETSIKYIKNNNDIDLIFMDIQLSDGLSFEIFTEIEFTTPVIFTTAFDNYMLNAFKVHSVDYILKPLEFDELQSAFDKYKTFYINRSNVDKIDFQNILSQFLNKSFKERFLVKSGAEIKYISIDNVAYFYSEDGYTHICTKDNYKHIIDYKLEELEKCIDPISYFRINRQIFVNIDSIKKIESYFNSRYKLQLIPKFNKDVIVSRDRAMDFRKWLDR